MPAPSASFLPALVDAVLARDVGQVTEEERQATSQFVARRIAGAAEPARLALRTVGAGLSVEVRLHERRGFHELSEERRRWWVDRWEATRLPGAGEYVDAVRSLVLAFIFEERLT